MKFIGSGPLAKAVLYYITDYIAKSQLKSHVTFTASELAVKKLGEYHLMSKAFAAKMCICNDFSLRTLCTASVFISDEIW